MLLHLRLITLYRQYIFQDRIEYSNITFNLFRHVAQSLCKDGSQEPVYHYSSHVNLLSPDYPNSYLGSERAPVICATQLSVTTVDKQEVAPKLNINVIQPDMRLLHGESLSLCHGNTLHVGASYEDLGPEPWKICTVAGRNFQIETPLKIVYHNNDMSHQQGVGTLIKIIG